MISLTSFGAIKQNLSNMSNFSPPPPAQILPSNKCKVCIHAVKLIQLDTLYSVL